MRNTASGDHAHTHPAVIGTPYPHMTQELLDDVRRRLRRAAGRMEFDNFAEGQLSAMSWLAAIDFADRVAIENEGYFLFRRAMERAYGRAEA